MRRSSLVPDRYLSLQSPTSRASSLLVDRWNPLRTCPHSIVLGSSWPLLQQRNYARKGPTKKRFGVIDTNTAKRMLLEQQLAKERLEERAHDKRNKRGGKGGKKFSKGKSGKPSSKDKGFKEKKERIVVDALNSGNQLQQRADADTATRSGQVGEEPERTFKVEQYNKWAEDEEEGQEGEGEENDEGEELEGEEEEEDEENEADVVGETLFEGEEARIPSEEKETIKKKKKKKKGKNAEKAKPRSRFREPDWPWVVFCTQAFEIVDFPGLRFSGKDITDTCKFIEDDEWIPFPEGCETMSLENRPVVGWDMQDRKFYVINTDPRFSFKQHKKTGYLPWAVAAVLPPAYVMLHAQAFDSVPDVTPLPLLAPTALGWFKDKLVVAATRVDADKRQDWHNFDAEVIERKIELKLKEMPNNRLVKWLARCADENDCPTANNYFMGRWEAPLPVATGCNAKCLGCPNYQEPSSIFKASLERIPFTPTAEEIAAVAVGHLQTAPDAIVSFGQTCDGEPLLQTELIAEAITMIRKATPRGTIHMNTNGTLPQCVSVLRQAGLDSMRVSVNTVRPKFYAAYYKPSEPDSAFEGVKESIKIMKNLGGFVSLDYMMQPGLNDQVEEFEYLCKFLEETQVDMVQWRTLNIDPDFYAKEIHFINRGPKDKRLREKMGIKNFMQKVKEAFPHMRFGHYNPSLDSSASKYNFDLSG